MIGNYFKIAWRALRRQLGYALINVIGLAAGLACCLLIGLWIQDELSYDAFHAQADRVHRVIREFDLPDLQSAMTSTPAALAPTLEDEVPGVAAGVRLDRRSEVVASDAHTAVASGILFADDGFFEVFDFRVVRGVAELGRPQTVLLTPETAKAHFPDRDPVGQTLQVADVSYEVTGIVAPPPSNSSIQYDMIAALQGAPGGEPVWGPNRFQSYVLLAPGTAPEGVEARLESIVEKYMAPVYEQYYDRAYPDGGYVLHLQPLTGVHLGQGVPVDIYARGSLTYVYLFGALALFVLLLAGINFVNLATARSSERADEVGVRKAVGAQRSQLAGQFLGEAVLMSSGATAVALGLGALALPAFNVLSGKTLSLDTLLAAPTLLVLAGIGLGVGLLAGAYPALVLSGFRPAEVLRGRSASSRGRPWLRQGLVVVQFTISIALLVGTGAVHQQLRFMQSAGLGFDEDNVVLIERARTLGAQHESFKAELRSQSSIRQVTSGFAMPGTQYINSMWRPDRPDASDRNLNYAFVDPEYIQTIGIQLVAGRAFDPERAADSSATVLSEAAARAFGWAPQEALGRRIKSGPNGTPYTVVGVAKNFHYESLHETIHPVALFPQRYDWHRRYVAARVQPGQEAAALSAIRAAWNQVSDLPADYRFLARELDQQYRAERRLQRIFGVVAGLAVLIACLGLLGLAAYTARQRTKEIGIRKALGASMTSIMGLLSKDFLVLVGIAFAVASPLAYVATQRWLQDFAYHITPGPRLFLLAGLLAVVAAALAAGSQAWRAARTDPARVLQRD
jgi:putative ABC transport system permease protein